VPKSDSQIEGAFMGNVLLRRTWTVTIFLTLYLSIYLPKLLYAHDNIQVHPYIAEQAFWIWPNDTSHEIYQYLGDGYRNTSTGDIACANAVDGNIITEGTKEEDDYNPIRYVCNDEIVNLGYGYYHHFYNPDEPEPYNGLLGSNGALSQAQAYLDLVKFYASTGISVGTCPVSHRRTGSQS
jgi:hypothetical protein